MAQEESHGDTLANRAACRQTGGSHLSIKNVSNGFGRGKTPAEHSRLDLLWVLEIPASIKSPF
jgi:hypothetical protein